METAERISKSPTNSRFHHCIREIEMDLYRTFPENSKFKSALHNSHYAESSIVSEMTQREQRERCLSSSVIGDLKSKKGIQPKSKLGGNTKQLKQTWNKIWRRSHSASDLALNHPSEITSSKSTILFRDSVRDSRKSSILKKIIDVETNPYIISLRHILVSFAYYSLPNEEKLKKCSRKSKYHIGYCQSLNFIVGMMLLVFANQDAMTCTAFESNDPDTTKQIQEDVFWLLVDLVENILPREMYGRNLEGVLTQQQILWDMIIKRKNSKFGFEELSKWCHKYTSASSEDSQLLTMITTPWFLSLYVNIMPPNVYFF